MSSQSKQIAKHFLEKAGISINGSAPWDMQVKDDAVYSQVISHGSLGLGESYMRGWWDAPKLDEFFIK